MSCNPSIDVDADIGGQLRRLRKNIGMSQKALALKLGISPQQVHKYEAGLNRLSAANLFVISRYLGVNPAIFYERLMAAHPVREVASTADDEPTQAILSALRRIEDSKLKHSILKLIIELSGNNKP